jgi:catechol 2,3-dioxygenase-like lactoylglutathione lyase family enzyme
MPLRHIALKTQDLEKTERFYADVLGLERAFDHPGMLFGRLHPRPQRLHDRALHRLA